MKQSILFRIVIFSFVFTLGAYLLPSLSLAQGNQGQLMGMIEGQQQKIEKDKAAAKEKIKILEERSAETTEAIKQKEEVMVGVKQEAEKVIEEKKAIEAEAALKEQAVVVIREELEALKQEAAVTQSPEAIKKAKELEKKASQVEEESEVAQKKLDVVQKKAALAETTISKNQEEIESLQKALEDLKKEKVAQRSTVEKLIHTGILFAVGLFLFLIGNRLIKWIVRIYTPKNVLREDSLTLQVKTVMNLLDWLYDIFVILFFLFLILETWGINMAPLIAGAGIVGLAFGFGGQYLIRDLINGLFILIEGQYRVNDVVKINEYGGLVEDINLRITTLRDLEGRVIIIPNGEIKIVVNFTKGYSQALFEIGVAYKENVDHVMGVIKELGQEMRQDEYFGRLIIADMEMFGVDSFGNSSVNIKFRMRTLPIKQWEVMREFNRRLKNKFDELGIEIPFPHQTIYWGSGEDNTWFKELANKHLNEKPKSP